MYTLALEIFYYLASTVCMREKLKKKRNDWILSVSKDIGLSFLTSCPTSSLDLLLFLYHVLRVHGAGVSASDDDIASTPAEQQRRTQAKRTDTRTRSETRAVNTYRNNDQSWSSPLFGEVYLCKSSVLSLDVHISMVTSVHMPMCTQCCDTMYQCQPSQTC